MGRKLPWASNNSITHTTRPVKRQKVDVARPKPEPVVKDESDSFLKTPTPRRARDQTRNGRSPSTSFPPAPSEIVFMREGINGDDVYMLVEDEFQSIAQSFTAHLHMAEYQRLKQEARERQTQRTSVVVPSNASVEVRQKHVRRDLEGRQERVLKDMGGAEEEEIEKEVLEPWAGTSLAGLMRRDGSQKTSLKGLDRLNSGSRAAQGLGPNSESGTQSQGTQRIVDYESREASRRVRKEEITVTVKKEKEVAEPVERKRREIYMQSGERKLKLSTNTIQRSGGESQRRDEAVTRIRARERNDVLLNSKPQSSEEAASTIKTTAGSRPNPAQKPKNFLDDLDDFDELGFARSQSDGKDDVPRSQSSAKPNPQIKESGRILLTKETTKDKKKDRRSRYDEIPVFLV